MPICRPHQAPPVVRAATLGHCPICAAQHKLTAHGRLPRHGFQAKNVRHGQTGGFHIGGHGGEPPIGTMGGNALALNTAGSHVATADRLAALPPHTIEQATEAALDEIWSNERQRATRWGRSSVEAPPVRPTAEQVRTEARYLSVRAWLTKGQLEWRQGSMDRARAHTIEAHRQHAATLRRLVKENPAG